MAAGGRAGKCPGGKIPAEVQSKPLEDSRSRYTQPSQWIVGEKRHTTAILRPHWELLTLMDPPLRRTVLSTAAKAPTDCKCQEFSKCKCLLMKFRLINKEAHWAFHSDSNKSIIISIGYTDRRDGWGVTRHLLILIQILDAHHGQPSGRGWIHQTMASDVRLTVFTWAESQCGCCT